MSDGAQGTEQAASAPVDGPKEIFVVGQTPPEVPKQADTEGKETETPKGEGLEEPKDNGDNRDETGRFKKRDGNNLQNRIDELTRARRDAEREVEYWRTRAGGQQQQATQQADGRPIRETFQTDEEYQEALVDYKVDQRLKRADEVRKVQEESTRKATSWEEKTQAARAELPDWDDVMSDNETQVAMHVAEAVMEHEHGAKIVHHLAQNPDLVEKLNGMSPLQMAFEVAKLGNKFDKPAAESSSKPPPQVSKAPPPPSKGVGAGRATDKSLGDMDMDEYMAARKTQGASWAR